MVLQQYKVLTFAETKRLIGLDDILFDLILFNEKLYVYNQNGKKVGRFSINIEAEEDKEVRTRDFLVHISNKACLEGVQSNTTSTGTVSQKLKTLEEIRYESCDIEKTGKQERLMYLLRESTKYYCSVTNSVCDVQHKHRTTLSFVRTTGLVGEAANAVLMRAIAIKGFEGILCLHTLLSNGKFCRNYYVSRLSHQYVNGKRMQVMVIFRNITNHKKYNLTLTTTLTRAGQMIYLFWSNTKYFVHIDPDLDVYEAMVIGERGVPLTRRWNRDEQLHSLYLDKKVELRASHRSYILDKAMLKRIISDFLQSVLLMQPNDVICFAVQYFTTFGRGTMKNCQIKSSQTSSKSKNTVMVQENHDDEEQLQSSINEYGTFNSQNSNIFE